MLSRDNTPADMSRMLEILMRRLQYIYGEANTNHCEVHQSLKDFVCCLKDAKKAGKTPPTKLERRAAVLKARNACKDAAMEDDPPQERLSSVPQPSPSPLTRTRTRSREPIRPRSPSLPAAPQRGRTSQERS